MCTKFSSIWTVISRTTFSSLADRLQVDFWQSFFVVLFTSPSLLAALYNVNYMIKSLQPRTHSWNGTNSLVYPSLMLSLIDLRAECTSSKFWIHMPSADSVCCSWYSSSVSQSHGHSESTSSTTESRRWSATTPWVGGSSAGRSPLHSFVW